MGRPVPTVDECKIELTYVKKELKLNEAIEAILKPFKKACNDLGSLTCQCE